MLNDLARHSTALMSPLITDRFFEKGTEKVQTLVRCVTRNALRSSKYFEE